jgi:hypothetical protein
MNPNRMVTGGLLAAALLSQAPPAAAQLKTPRVSPSATVSQTLGITDLTVTYSRPGVKKRVIWGELLPYDKPWRAGANEATTFTTTDEIQFGGQKLAAGTYSLFMIPSKGDWTVVLNSEKDIWGTAHDEKKDFLKFSAKPAATESQEWLRYSFENLANNSCDLVMRWEKVAISVPISMDVNAKVLAGIRTALAAAKPDDWKTRVSASRWCMDNDQATSEARGWCDQALAIKKNYSTLALLARWQAKEGKKKDAIATVQLAIADGKADAEKPDMTTLEKLLSDWKSAE